MTVTTFLYFFFCQNHTFAFLVTCYVILFMITYFQVFPLVYSLNFRFPFYNNSNQMLLQVTKVFWVSAKVVYKSMRMYILQVHCHHCSSFIFQNWNMFVTISCSILNLFPLILILFQKKHSNEKKGKTEMKTTFYVYFFALCIKSQCICSHTHCLTLWVFDSSVSFSVLQTYKYFINIDFHSVTAHIHAYIFMYIKFCIVWECNSVVSHSLQMQI